jgi:hypothetical protein
LLDNLIDGKTLPDVIFDATQAGDASEAVKSLTKSLGMPTVSLSYGGQYDSRWRNCPRFVRPHFV